MKAVHELPDGYVRGGEVSLSDRRFMLVLYLAALPWTLLCGFVILNAAAAIRPFAFQLTAGSITWDIRGAAVALAVVGTVVATATLHEGAHAAVFAAVTRHRPAFGVKVVLLYTSAPGWFVTYWAFVAAGIAPVLLLTTAGVVVYAAVPGAVGWLALFGAALNAVGSLGDVVILGRLQFVPRTSVVLDTGSRIEWFVPSPG